MNTQLTNIAENTSLCNPEHLGYQELKLISFYHDTECYRIVGPIAVTREVEVALLLWVPTLDPEARQSSDFTGLWIKAPLMIRFACELWRRFQRKGAGLVQKDAEQALENAAQPTEHNPRDGQSHHQL
jgi:hypothetical protein